MIDRSFRFALATVLLLAPSALPAQRMSDSYEFLKAVRGGDGTKVTEFLDRPGTTVINTKDSGTGETALHIVAKRSDTTYIRYLIGKGANVNAQDGRGNSALMIAVEANCGDCIDILVRQKANVNLGNSSGETPLIRAVQLRNLDLSRKLLTAGANPDQADVLAGMSARDYAKRDSRSPALIKLLTDAPKSGGNARGVAGPRL